LIRSRYDDGGYSGGSTERPDLQRLLDDIRARKIDVIVVYKVDRLTRSLADFAKLVELFDAHGVSFVSVTQQFNTTGKPPVDCSNVLTDPNLYYLIASSRRSSPQKSWSQTEDVREPKIPSGRPRNRRTIPPPQPEIHGVEYTPPQHSSLWAERSGDKVSKTLVCPGWGDINYTVPPLQKE
jgi:hypothetical protein